MKKAATKTKKIVLFDAHAILHRAYHALPDFTSTKGEPTGALYGLTSMLLRIITDLKPDYLVACYDRAEATFRKVIYDDYKGTRAKTDDALVAQMDRSREIFEALGIPVYDEAGFEADDIIGTLVEQLKKEKNLQVIIASGDMDTMQLVDGDRVVVYTLKKGINDTILYNEKAVVERFGFAPKFLADYKGLRGDPSDNIIGIKGIGEKTATELIQKFGTIEALYKKLKKSPAEFEAAGFKERMITLLKEGEEEALFSKTLATIRRDAPVSYKLPAKTWRETFTIAPAEKLFIELDFRSLLGRVKTLFSGVQVLSEDMVAEEVEEEIVIPEDEFKPLAIAFTLINSDITNPTAEDIFNFAKTKDVAEAKKVLLAELAKRGLMKVYEEIELPLIPIINRAEEHGVAVDVPYFKKLSKDYHQKLMVLEKKIHQLAGSEFNINSPKQLGEVLFDKLALNVKGLKKTAGGERSTRESELVKLKDIHPIIAEILSYRELQKLLSTYIDTIPTMVAADGRLHTKLNQLGATTGRMSSNNPNLQNIPASEGLGEAIRQAFVAEPGFKWAAFDYSQIEMRVLAILSGDEKLKAIFKEGKDIHASVAALVFGVAETAVTKDMRRAAKVINFGIIYGMGVNALRANLGGTRAEAQKFYDDYFHTFPRIKNYFDEVIADAYRKGYTETYFGRRRYFPGLKSSLPFIRASAERMAMNAPIQGTATADTIKIAMIKVDEIIKQEKLEDKVFLLLQVHDELIYEIKDDVVAKIAPKIKKAMEDALQTDVPIVANFSAGATWADTK